MTLSPPVPSTPRGRAAPLKQLAVQRFRSLRDFVWSPGPISVLIGENASGKSNVLSALEFLSRSAEGTLRDCVEEWGGAHRLAWAGLPEPMEFRVELGDPLGDPMDTHPDLGLQYELRLRPVGDSGDYRIVSERLIHTFRDITDAVVEEAEPLAWADTGREPQVLRETLLSRLGPDRGADAAIRELQQQMRGWRRFASFRTDHRRRASEGAPVRRAADSAGERLLDGDGANLVNVLDTLLRESDRFHDDMHQALEAAFPDRFDGLEVSNANGVSRLQVRWKGLRVPQSGAELSDGTLRFVFLCAALAHPEPPSVIAIDEPETSLHPRMLPILAELAQDVSRKSQVIIATHSESVLDAFQGCGAQPHVVSSDDQGTSIRPVDPVELEFWLREYSLGELFRTNRLEHLATAELDL